MENIILYILLIAGWLFTLFLIFFYRKIKIECNELNEAKKRLEAMLTKEQQENLNKEEKLQSLAHIESRFYKILPALVEERKQKIDELLTDFTLQCNLLNPLYVAQKNEIHAQIIKIEELMEDVGFNELFEQIKHQLIELKKTTYKLECEQLFTSTMAFLDSIDKDDEREKKEPDGEGIKKIEQFYQNYIEEIAACEFKGKSELIELKKKLLVLLLCYKEFKILHLYYILWGKNIEKSADAETHKKQIENYKPEALEKTKPVKEKYCN
ncbi:MAG: hypothetical protein FWC34_11745 [Bacteroidetes bacterium]|nr:hypothetical protein [Bacteroidota bacterium]MCL2302087.1 hypothetical protein [Lentimicrobiaceae bacterium]